MKFVIVLTVIALVAAKPADDYSKYENFDVTEILGNVRLLKAYCNCFLGVGKCTQEAADIKEWIPESVQSNCAKCSEKQKTLIAKVILAIEKQLPNEWEQLKKLHNPDGKYTDSLSNFIEKYGK